MVRRWFYALSALVLIGVALLSLVWPGAAWSLLIVAPLIVIGLRDSLQHHHTILRNFPLTRRIPAYTENSITLF